MSVFEAVKKAARYSPAKAPAISQDDLEKAIAEVTYKGKTAAEVIGGFFEGPVKCAAKQANEAYEVFVVSGPGGVIAAFASETTAKGTAFDAASKDKDNWDKYSVSAVELVTD